MASCALLHKKTLLLADEATSALDRDSARQVEESLLGLEGVTCIAVTHRLDAHCAQGYDGVLTLRDGRLTPSAGHVSLEKC